MLVAAVENRNHSRKSMRNIVTFICAGAAAAGIALGVGTVYVLNNATLPGEGREASARRCWYVVKRAHARGMCATRIGCPRSEGREA
jgi:cobalamin biosynthesis protein CobD/CbiB